MNGKILVLGGTGFAGRNVMEVLGEAGLPCLSASRSEGTDVRVPGAARDLFRHHRPKIVINCAAHVGSLNYVTEQAADVIADNTRMILAMYEAIAAECPQTLVINPIANCAYPAMTNTFEEDHWWDGHLHRSVLSYGSTRRLLWSIGECFQMQYGVRSVYFLVPNMYGPYDSTDPNKAHALNALAAKFVKAKATKQKEVVIWGTGVAVREWLFAPDFARVVLEVIRNPGLFGLNEPLNIGQNFGFSVRELAELIARAADYSGQIRYDHTMPDGAPRKIMDDRRFRKVFPTFKFTELDAGLKRTIAYYGSILPY
jgi:GDP-L-fucose synthase